ncbi:response regulator [Paenibacillus sp. GCM10023248]|uniref:response regulator n=1 Tax=unclassified Paenibacillus TaxID=185978 RepID=UPI002377F9EF|nr:response regulator [Paenibacillus sp. MAHUQ-63]MDD9265797.1 response regulator [Paenibacillus sp. MAHUQ-63]
MRILIVDDEILVRIGLKTIIPMDSEEFQVIGEAANGVEALSILETQPCEIVLTDIRMPEMDGLALLKIIRERWSQVKCLILSNHSDFAYVQQALRLGATEYITKLEINPSELMQKLRAIKEQLLIEKQGQNAYTKLEQKVNLYSGEVKEKRLRELVLGHSSRREVEQVFSEFQLGPFPAPLSAVAIQIEAYDELIQNNRFQSDRLLSYTVKNVLSEILKKHGNGELVEIGGGKFGLLTGQLNTEVLREMQSAVQTFLRISISCGVSPAFEDACQLHHAFEQADHSLSYRFYGGRACIVHYSEIPPVPPRLSEPWNEDDLSKRIDEGDADGITQLLLAWTKDLLAKKNVPPLILREMWLSLLHMFSRSLKAEGTDIYSVTLHEN